MEDLLLFHGELDDLVIITGDGDHAWRALDGDQLGARRQLQGVGERSEAGRDLVVGFCGGESCFLSHSVLELVEAEVGFAKIDGEIGADCKNK